MIFSFYSLSKSDPKFGDAWWKRKFSNFWGSIFIIDSQQWPSVEHYYQYQKYQLGNLTNNQQLINISGHLREHAQQMLYRITRVHQVPEDPNKYLSKIGLGAKTLALKYHKEISFPPEIWKHWVKISKKVMKKGLVAKFSQNEGLRNLLISTGNVYLSHFAKFQPRLALTSNYSNYYWGQMITTKETLKKNPQWVQLQWIELSDQPEKVLVGQNQMGHLLMEVRSELASHVAKNI